MEKPTGSNLLSLYGELEIRVTKWVGKRKTKLFCRKHETLVTAKFNEQHHCLKPKRIYEKEGKKVIVFCPHLYTLKGKPFYKQEQSLIYEDLGEVYEVSHGFKRRPQPLEKKEKSIFEKQAQTLARIVSAGKQLTSGSG